MVGGVALVNRSEPQVPTVVNRSRSSLGTVVLVGLRRKPNAAAGTSALSREMHVSGRLCVRIAAWLRRVVRLAPGVASMTPQVRRIVLVAGVGVVLLMGFACVAVYQIEIEAGERRVRAFWGELVEEYRPQEVLKPLPPIVLPPAVSVAESEGKLAADELVLGVVVNGEARAYPINMLTGPEREIFNDALGGREIAATW